MAFFNQSKFSMWRACVAAAWVKGPPGEVEIDWIMDKIEELPFNEEQRQALLQDLQGGVDFQAMATQITDKRDRAFLVNQLRILTNLQRTPAHPTLESYQQAVLAGIDFKALGAQKAPKKK